MISEERQIKHKGGRPRKPVTKTVVTSLRLSKTERYIIKHKADQSGLSITAYIRQMAIHGKVITRMNEEERQFVRHVTSLANNFNQLTKKAHQEGLLRIIILFENYRNQFDELLKRFKK